MDLTLGEKIMILRKKRKISQREFAKILGISHSNLPSYESNKYKPSIEMLIKIADFFQISLDELIREKTVENLSTIKDREIIQLARLMDALGEKDKNFLKSTIKNYMENRDS